MIGRRLIGAIPVLLGISFLVFLLMHLAPGDPVVLLLGDEATPADVARVRHEWGLDQSLPVQYWQFVSRAMESAPTGRPDRIWHRGQPDHPSVSRGQPDYRRLHGFLERITASHDAGCDVGHRARGDCDADYPLECARGHAPGVRHDGAGERTQ